jgi:small subunit ribosomal protein S16
MVVIRLARGGSHNRPFFNIVVADKRNRRDGRFIERLGFHNPLVKEGVVGTNITQWIVWLIGPRMVHNCHPR